MHKMWDIYRRVDLVFFAMFRMIECIPVVFEEQDSDHRNGSNSSFVKQLLENETYLESYFSITCCRQGTPIPEASVAKYAKNFTAEKTGVIFADQNRNISCDRYNGKYSIPAHFSYDKDYTSGVKCQCNGSDSDRNCRKIKASCQNGGYRAFSINLRCSCPGSYFGEFCEKYCLNGQIFKKAEDVAFCACFENFYGSECDNILCFNGGIPVNGRGCSCPQLVHGRHCNVVPGRTNEHGNYSNGHYWLDFLYKIAVGLSILALLVGSMQVFYVIFKRRQMLKRTTFNGHWQASSEPTNQSSSSLTTILAPLPTYDQATKA